MKKERSENIDNRPLSIFISHLSENSTTATAIKDELYLFGIDSFVAHIDINPTSAWQEEIEKYLSTCHAGIILFQDKFIESKWCDQECGWIMGRGLPIIIIKCDGSNPYGFLGKWQALSGINKVPQIIVPEILDILDSKEFIRNQIIVSYSKALLNSTSFNLTDRITARLERMDGAFTDSIEYVLTAVRDNSQVYFSGNSGKLLAYVHRQPGIEKNTKLFEEVSQAEMDRQEAMKPGGKTPMQF